MDVHNFVYNRAKFSSNARVMFIKINFMLYYKENFIELQKLKKLMSTTNHRAKNQKLLTKDKENK